MKKMTNKGILTVVSGFSGAGKGTLMRELMKNHDNYSLSISATTRKPREGEVDGREYFFTTKEKFMEMIEDDQLIEYAKYVDNYYGTPRRYVEEQLLKGKDVILEIEIQGALKIKEKYPDSLLLFVMPPNAEELVHRLKRRGTEDLTTITQRMLRACEEARGVEQYDYLVINDKIEDCTKKMHQIIQNEHCKTFRNIDLIENIREELKSFSKGE